MKQYKDTILVLHEVEVFVFALKSLKVSSITPCLTPPGSNVAQGLS